MFKYISFALFVVMASCSNGREYRRIQESVYECAAIHPSGFTLDVKTLQPVSEGVAVAFAETQNTTSQAGLKKVIAHALEHDGYVGLWLNEKDSTYYYDSVKLFPEDSVEQALEFGVRNHQRSVFIISKDSTIWLATQN